MEENVLSWDHIDKFFKVDQTQEIRLAPKLTHLHIFKHGYSDMRVNLAAQEFSRTVSAGLHCHSVSGFIPKEAVYTAKSYMKLTACLIASIVAQNFIIKKLNQPSHQHHAI